MKTFPSLSGGCGVVLPVEWAWRPSVPGKEQMPHYWSFPVRGPQIRSSVFPERRPWEKLDPTWNPITPFLHHYTQTTLAPLTRSPHSPHVSSPISHLGFSKKENRFRAVHAVFEKFSGNSVLMDF
jgi:hypothetical protein